LDVVVWISDFTYPDTTTASFTYDSRGRRITATAKK